ncbi:MAG: transcriptional regulator, partial [Acidobacteria bacterium]|nr:transcriptional regulator [Acidobacteriota bacterium]
EILAAPRPNLLRLLFAPDGLRPQILNWEVVARSALQRAHQEAMWTCDQELEALVQELAASLPRPSQARELPEESCAVTMALEVRRGDNILRFLSTITTLGAPQDVTLQELRIEAFYPADEETDRCVTANFAKATR